jgi:cytochrome c oxidase subunit II
MKSIKSIIVLALALLSLPVVGAAGRDTTPRRIEITASKFSYNPSAITLKKGEPVVLALRSTDVTHGLVVKDLGVKVELKKDQTQEVTITPDKVGTFQGKCSHFCGKGHGSMILDITVVE